MDLKLLKRVSKTVMKSRLASRESDPRFYSGLNILPNPDPILRKLGRAEDVYDAILSDAHVIGEVQAIRSSIIGAKRRIKLSDKSVSESSPEHQALELVREWMAIEPNNVMTWDDVIWSMWSARLNGYQAHELAWFSDENRRRLPQIFDVPCRRIRFSNESELRLLTRDQPTEGIKVAPYKFVTTRHMPSTDNPYGRAILSSLFWPYTFKHGGFKFFYKFVERYGLPWPIGKYPAGSTEPQINDLVDALEQMVDDGVAVIPDDGQVDLLESKSIGGDVPQLALIAICNKEMSKALTSQTLATDIDGAGSRAASEVHHKRERGVSQADKNIISTGMNQIIRLITNINFGPQVAAPEFEFYDDVEPTSERAAIWEIASRIGNPSKKAFHDEMRVPQAEDDDDKLGVTTLLPTADNPNFNAHHRNSLSFNLGEPSFTSTAAATADDVIERDFIEPIASMLREYEESGKTLTEFSEDLPKLFQQLDDEALQRVTAEAIQYAAAEGAATD